MKSYYRIMLGRKHALAMECLEGGYICTGFGFEQDFTGKLPDDWRTFNKAFIPVFLANRPDKSRVVAGLACGAVWTICKGINEGDIILSPDGTGVYHLGEVTGEYYYVAGNDYPHRRRVKWLGMTIERSAMSEALRNSTGSIGTVSNITSHAVEIERFLQEASHCSIVATDPVIEDPSAFAMEEHLENFLVKNWGHTELAKEFLIYQEEGEVVGQQYETDCGRIDILAESKDRKRILVIELKRGRTSDVVVGQTLRYMGYVQEEIAEPDQKVEGAIIALEDDQKLRWALAAVPNVSFYRYQISFKLVKA
ncbi:MAG: endonuclease NucS domain-containing protein [Bdellovibrionales bacterium]